VDYGHDDVHRSTFVFVVEKVKCICRMGVNGCDVSDVLYIFVLDIGQFDLYKRSDKYDIVISTWHCAYIYRYYLLELLIISRIVLLVRNVICSVIFLII